MKMIYAPEATWKELDGYVLNISKNYSRPLLHEINKKPLSSEGISQLVQEGWRLDVVYRNQKNYGYCFKNIKIIVINGWNAPYERDKTLFHELVHAWLGDIANDSSFVYNPLAKENNIIVEWIARQYRASQLLLKTALNAFNLPIHVYDKASYFAKHPEENRTVIAVQKNNQLVLPFSENLVDCMRTWMD